MRWLVLVALTGCSFSAEISSTSTIDIDAIEVDADQLPVTPDAAMPKPPDFHLRIAAVIDGESYLHVKGKTAWFENRIFAAPGRWDANAMSPWDIRPITLTQSAAVQWLPTWPDVPNPENRDCMCLSSTTQLPVGVPSVPSTTTFTEVDVRRPQGIIQTPSAANDWELIVLVSDYTIGGAHLTFVLDVDVKPN